MVCSCQCLSRRTLYPPPEREEVEGLRVLGVLAFFVEVDLLLEDLEDDFEEEDDLLLTLERREVDEVRRRAGVFVTVAVVSRTRVLTSSLFCAIK